MRKCRNLTPRLLCGRTLFGIRDPAYFNQRLSIFIDGASGVGFQWPAMAFAGRLRPKQNFNSPKNSNSMQFIDRLNYINNFHLNIDKICVKILAKLRFRTANGVCKAHHLCRRSNDSLKGSDSEMCRERGENSSSIN